MKSLKDDDCTNNSPLPGQKFSSEVLELTEKGGKGKKGVANQDGSPAPTDEAPGASEKDPVTHLARRKA
jgi:hypothetical protein